MPALSLVVCVHKERELFQRLLKESAGCHDELVVVHDGTDTLGIRELVEETGGRFFERPLTRQQEPHWPFAWKHATHEWILRLDADEFPGDEMKIWLKKFRQSVEPPEHISGFSCIWPLWNGYHMVSKKWPAGRGFLFHKQRVRIFGMNEQSPIFDGQCEALDLILNHQPKRKSYGWHNILVRTQAYKWRRSLAEALLGKPTDLSCWRWDSAEWPPVWEQIRTRPLRTAFTRLTMGTLRALRDQWRIEGRLMPVAAVSGPIHHALICFEFWRLRRRQRREKQIK